MDSYDELIKNLRQTVQHLRKEKSLAQVLVDYDVVGYIFRLQMYDTTEAIVDQITAAYQSFTTPWGSDSD